MVSRAENRWFIIAGLSEWTHRISKRVFGIMCVVTFAVGDSLSARSSRKEHDQNGWRLSTPTCCPDAYLNQDSCLETTISSVELPMQQYNVEISQNGTN
eukprot:m.189173 g.189173  ORF g.189173 m.189173 type:complete len:99 (-) comp18528_c0_seq73:978-1274(-)